LAKSDSRGDGEAAEIELTYSTTGGISRAKPALGTLKLCIIQVIRAGGKLSETWQPWYMGGVETDTVSVRATAGIDFMEDDRYAISRMTKTAVSTNSDTIVWQRKPAVQD